MINSIYKYLNKKNPDILKSILNDFNFEIRHDLPCE